jgi:hypothetical protein
VLAVNTTVVAVVGPPDATPLRAVRAANVRVLHTDGADPALDRALQASQEARRTTSPYLLHDADPLAAVARAWVSRFDESGDAGDLAIAVADVLARWRGRSIDMPDYYLLVDLERFTPTARHWYLGVLGVAAPVRVVPAPPSAPLVDALPGLRPGPWWPDLDRLLTGIDQVVPDKVGLPVST